MKFRFENKYIIFIIYNVNIYIIGNKIEINISNLLIGL